MRRNGERQVTLDPDLAARLLTEIRDGGLSSRALAWLFEATDAPIEQGAGYTGRWTHTPVDKYGAPIVPGDWPVNPRGRVA